MSGSSETYPGCNLSLSQLLDATKKKLHDIVLGGMCVRNIDLGEPAF